MKPRIALSLSCILAITILTASPASAEDVGGMCTGRYYELLPGMDVDCGCHYQPICITIVPWEPQDPCDDGYRKVGLLCEYKTYSEEPETDSTITVVPPQAAGQPLWGWVDSHEHQFANLAYGGVVFWGAPYHEDGINAALAQCDYTDQFSTRFPNLALLPDTAAPADPLSRGYGVHGWNKPLESSELGAILAGLLNVIPDYLGTPDLPLVDQDIYGLTNNISTEFFPDGHEVWGSDLFEGWPRYDNGGHQQMYHKWLERAYQGGMRILVNLAVNNEVLCWLSFRRNGFSCDDMFAVDLQIQAMKDLEAYIDAQCGDTAPSDLGDPGHLDRCGWYRIVRSSEEAREVIEAGKMAVIIGIEVDTLFSCKPDVEFCDATYVTQQIEDYYDMGVRYVFPVHFFDNQFAGGSLYRDTFAYANYFATGGLIGVWDCGVDEGYDFKITPFEVWPWENPTGALFAPLQFTLDPAQTTIDWLADAHCNARGLTPAGEHLIGELMDKDMIIDIDHLSLLATGFVEKATGYRREGILDIAEDRHDARGYTYPLVSGHSNVKPLSKPAKELSVTHSDGLPGTCSNDDQVSCRNVRDCPPATGAGPRVICNFSSEAERIRNLGGVVALNQPRGECDTTREFLEGTGCDAVCFVSQLSLLYDGPEEQLEAVGYNGSDPLPAVTVSKASYPGGRGIFRLPGTHFGSDRLPDRLVLTIGQSVTEIDSRCETLDGGDLYPPFEVESQELLKRHERGNCDVLGYKALAGLMQDGMPQTHQDYPGISLQGDFGAFNKQPGPRYKKAADGGIGEAICDARNTPSMFLNYWAGFPAPGTNTGDLFFEQKTGHRTFDYNFDGLAHIGLLPDMLADAQKLVLGFATCSNDYQMSCRHSGDCPAGEDVTCEQAGFCWDDDLLPCRTDDHCPTGVCILDKVLPSHEVYQYLDPVFNSAEAFVRLWERIDNCTPDTEAPSIFCPSVVTASTLGAGLELEYPLTAVDEYFCDLWPRIEVEGPESGDFVEVGTASVTATVRDEAGFSDSCQFSVNVSCFGVNLLEVNKVCTGINYMGLFYDGPETMLEVVGYNGPDPLPAVTIPRDNWSGRGSFWIGGQHFGSDRLPDRLVLTIGQSVTEIDTWCEAIEGGVLFPPFEVIGVELIKLYEDNSLFIRSAFSPGAELDWTTAPATVTVVDTSDAAAPRIFRTFEIPAGSFEMAAPGRYEFDSLQDNFEAVFDSESRVFELLARGIELTPVDDLRTVVVELVAGEGTTITRGQMTVATVEGPDVLRYRRDPALQCGDSDDDGIHDGDDNCVGVPNPGQSDVDDDLEGDHCDLQDGMIYVISRGPGSMDWQEETGFDSWNCYRGDLELLKSSLAYTQLPFSVPLAGRQCGMTVPTMQDLIVPDEGKVAFYLVTGVAGGVEADLGMDGAGSPRLNANPCL